MEVLQLGMLNTPEIIMILVLALILFGAKKLPELAKGLGHGIKEFRKASREISEELNSAMDEGPSPRKSTPNPVPPPPAGSEPQYGYGSTEPYASLSEAATESRVPSVSSANNVGGAAEPSSPDSPGAEVEPPIANR